VTVIVRCVTGRYAVRMRRTRQIGHHHGRQSVDHFSDIDDRDTREWLEPDMEDDFRDYAYRDEPYVPR